MWRLHTTFSYVYVAERKARDAGAGRAYCSFRHTASSHVRRRRSTTRLHLTYRFSLQLYRSSIAQCTSLFYQFPRDFNFFTFEFACVLCYFLWPWIFFERVERSVEFWWVVIHSNKWLPAGRPRINQSTMGKWNRFDCAKSL